VDSRLDPAVETTTLDNGLAVTTVALPHLHTAVCALFIKVGARFELPEDNGLSHFTEHMLFRGTERYPTSLALNTAVERLGSTLHAETGRDYTLFQLALEPELVTPAIDVLGELLARPRFSDIELERELVLEEINEDYDEQGVEINADDIAASCRLRCAKLSVTAVLDTRPPRMPVTTSARHHQMDRILFTATPT
jgi:predicted Zn-dependent peptidase